MITGFLRKSLIFCLFAFSCTYVCIFNDGNFPGSESPAEREQQSPRRAASAFSPVTEKHPRWQKNGSFRISRSVVRGVSPKRPERFNGRRRCSKDPSGLEAFQVDGKTSASSEPPRTLPWTEEKTAGFPCARARGPGAQRSGVTPRPWDQQGHPSGDAHAVAPGTVNSGLPLALGPALPQTLVPA